jgi:hypothetical protein
MYVGVSVQVGVGGCFGVCRCVGVGGCVNAHAWMTKRRDNIQQTSEAERVCVAEERRRDGVESAAKR